VVPLTVARLAALALCLGAGAVTPSSADDVPDARYVENGVDPSKILGRLEGRRALETGGAYDAAGTPLFFHRFGALRRDGFSGGSAVAVADEFRVFVFPRRQGRPQSLALSELRQDPLFDTTPGYLRRNPLGLWRLTFVRFTPAAFSSSAGLLLLEGLRKRNGTDLDGTPLLKHVSDVRELASRGFATVEPRPEDGTEGPPWVLWRLIADPRRERIPADAPLMLVARVDGVPADRELEQQFLALVEAGVHAAPPMPNLPPFVQPLPLPARLPVGKGVELHERPFLHRFHPDLPPTTLWGYEGMLPGPTLTLRRGERVVLRNRNALPPDGSGGFGRPWTQCLVRLPAGPVGFSPAPSAPGQTQDQDLSAPQAGSGWYGDAAPGFSAPNLTKGLAGFVEVRDEFDSGDENDPSSGASRLPSGAFDVPLLLGDRRFDVTLDHALSWDAFEIDGAPGEVTTVNGAAQPYFRVARRKYRFRILNGGPTRFYELALSSGQLFHDLGDDGGPRGSPIRRSELRLSPGRLVDVIVDFSGVALGSEVLLENRQPQENGKGPIARPLSPEGDRRVMKFIVDRDAPDPSRIPARWNGAPADAAASAAPTRTFVLDNRRGAWTVNGNVYDAERVDARVKRGASEVWILKNASKEWTHPVPGAPEDLRPGGEVRLLLRFGDKPGRYILPCGSPAHADLGLLIQWDLEP
jgi:FtsP/CotA-like multicopper oxidase with cupredoxin domain